MSVRTTYRQLPALAYNVCSTLFLTTPLGARIVLRYVATHLTRVLRRKPILSEQALPVLRRSPRIRTCPKASWMQKEIAMRTHQQLKIVLTGVLIALAALAIVTAPAQVTSSAQSKGPAVVRCRRMSASLRWLCVWCSRRVTTLSALL